MSFDSLTYACRLKSAGFSETQAEALADANRELLVPDLATKADLAAVEQRLNAAIQSVEQRLGASIEALGLRLTVRLGAMMAAAIAVLGGILRVH
jgi:hypothetical protein